MCKNDGAGTTCTVKYGNEDAMKISAYQQKRLDQTCQVELITNPKARTTTNKLLYEQKLLLLNDFISYFHCL